MTYQTYTRWEHWRLWVYRDPMWNGWYVTVILGPFRIRRITEKVPPEELF